MKTPGQAETLPALACLAALLALPAFAGRFELQLATEILIAALFAQSLGLLVGFAGLVSLGHAGLYGFAAYLTVLLSPAGGASLFWLLPAVVAATALLALAIGALVVRSRGIYFIMATLAFGQMIYHLFHDSPLGGGSDGIFLDDRPRVALGGRTLVDLGDRPQLYYVALAALVLALLFLRRLLQAPFGRAIVALRDNEGRLAALGFEPVRLKLLAFVLAGGLAAVAGLLATVQTRFVNPEMAGWHGSANVLLMVILGGVDRLYGPTLGAAAFVLLQHVLVGWTAHWALPLGALIIAAVLLLPQGLVTLPARLTRRDG